MASPPHRAGDSWRGPPPTTAPEGSFNLRDLGGVPTMDGGEVRQGLVYRSGDPDNVTPAGWEAVAGLGGGPLLRGYGPYRSGRGDHPGSPGCLASRPACLTPQGEKGYGADEEQPGGEEHGGRVRLLEVVAVGGVIAGDLHLDRVCADQDGENGTRMVRRPTVVRRGTRRSPSPAPLASRTSAVIGPPPAWPRPPGVTRPRCRYRRSRRSDPRCGRHAGRAGQYGQR